MLAAWASLVERRGKHEGTLHTRLTFDYAASLRIEMHGSRTCLGVREVKLAGFNVNVLPLKRLDFLEPAAREHEQTDCGHRGSGLRAVFVNCVEDMAEAGEFILGQESLARLLLVALDVKPGVRAVGPQPSELGEVEHLVGRVQKQSIL